VPTTSSLAFVNPWFNPINPAAYHPVTLDPHHNNRYFLLEGPDPLDYTLTYFFRHCEEAFKGGALQLEYLDSISQSALSEVGYFACSHDGSSLLSLLLDDHQKCTCLAEGLLRRQLQHYGQANACATVRNDAIEGTIPYLDVDSAGNVRGFTPLLSAIYLGHSRPIHLLLDCGADPNLGSRTNAPLLLALRNNDHDLVELLLHHGASLDLVYTHRSKVTTLLATALRSLATECVKILLERGADPNFESPDGSPLLLALEMKTVAMSSSYCTTVRIPAFHANDATE
jgi:hypothetical protein